jgi:alkanesulfonate monooxygenase SsuD/methylene tetrahydromethanopterin reductase-like flavin-dependent oxidoreductase (luciferase family)
VTPRLRVGITIDLVPSSAQHSLGENDYRRALSAARRTEELGYDAVWLSEHHFVEGGYCPSLLPLAAAMLAQTSRLRVGTYVLLLLLHHPIRVAEDVAVLDVLSGGRSDCGVGMGYRIEEYAGLGVDARTRVSRMDECSDLLVRAWTERNWSHRGHHFSLCGVDVQPRPVQQPVSTAVGERPDPSCNCARGPATRLAVASSAVTDLILGLNLSSDIERFAVEVLPHLR